MKIERDERRFDFHDIGLAIKRAREASGMTQEQLAYIVDRAPRTIMYSQHEKHRPGIAEGATGQQIGRNPHRARTAEADKLAFGEVESHLCFDFG